MKRISCLCLLLFMFIGNVFAGVGKFESFNENVRRGGYTVCDSIVKKNCIELTNSSNTNQGLFLSNKASDDEARIKENSNYIAGANDSYFNPNDNDFDKNAVANFNITNSNQTLMQTYSPELNPDYTPATYILEKVVIPVKTTENSSLSVGTNKVEFNLSY